jgi:hypothetical protein
MIHAEILSALNSIGVPVELFEYTGDEKTYITFFQYDETKALNANDEEIITNYYYQINVLSDKDYSNLVQTVKEKMREIDGIRINETELFKNGYQRSMRFKFTK